MELYLYLAGRMELSLGINEKRNPSDNPGDPVLYNSLTLLFHFDGVWQWLKLWKVQQHYQEGYTSLNVILKTPIYILQLN